jgi:hypothetical protein
MLIASSVDGLVVKGPALGRLVKKRPRSVEDKGTNEFAESFAAVVPRG